MGPNEKSEAKISPKCIFVQENTFENAVCKWRPFCQIASQMQFVELSNLPFWEGLM